MCFHEDELLNFRALYRKKDKKSNLPSVSIQSFRWEIKKLHKKRGEGIVSFDESKMGKPKRGKAIPEDRGVESSTKFGEVSGKG